MVISQSGETIDTLAALRYAKTQGQTILSVVNVAESAIARESDVVLRTLAGPEISVASTKAFTTQLTVLACLAIAAARGRHTIDPNREAELSAALTEVPARAAEALSHNGRLREIAHDIAKPRPGMCCSSDAAPPFRSLLRVPSSSKRSPRVMQPGR